MESTIDIDREYFMDEVRDGFFVPSIMKKAWAVSILTYKELERVCDEIGVGVFFIFGNLIGAIRHGGSIPWDDDIDVGMIASDYQKLKAYIDKHGAPKGYQLRDYSDMESGNFFRKWYDDINPVKNIDKWKEYFGFPYVGVTDIMPMDYVPDDEEELGKLRKTANLLQELKDYADAIEAGEKIDRQDYRECLKRVEKAVGQRYDAYSGEKLSVWAWRMLEQYSLRYEPDSCKDVMMMSYYMMRGTGRYPKGYVRECIDMPFEFTTVRVPIGYDRHLRNFYGNYMIQHLDGSPHAYPYYRILEQALRDKYGLELWKYDYDAQKVSEIKNNRNKGASISEVIKTSLEVMKEAHEFIISSLREGSVTKEFTDILGSCQKVAVQIGEIIEKKVKDYGDIVTVLERYCENVYGVYQAVADGTGSIGAGTIGDMGISIGEGTGTDQVCFAGIDIERAFLSVESELESFAESITKEDEIKQVVFIVRTPEEWKSLHSIYSSAKKDENWIATAIVVPYYYKTYDGDLDIDNPVYITKGYPDDVEFTLYEKYDLEMEHPDVVVFQCPYDNCSDAYMIHPSFHAESLVKYTDKLVFIPPFKVMEVGEHDGRSRYTLGRFVRTPGFVYADEIIAQSEGMKDIYEELLSELDPDVEWGKKISPLGTAIDDDVYREEMSRKDEKRTVIHYLSPSIVFEYGKAALDRTERLIDMVDENISNDIRLICQTDPATERIVEKYYPDERDRLECLYKKGGFIVDQSVCITENPDGFIGDAQYGYTKCNNRKKPAMILAPDELKSAYDDRSLEDFFEAVERFDIGKCFGSGEKPFDGRVGSSIWEHISR